MAPRVGAVVPCKDEIGSIERCLRALRGQQPAPERIVVVDNGSTDGSLEVARRLADEVLEVPAARIGELRNRGAAALGDVDVIAFVDADCELAPGWVAAAVGALADADLVGSRSLAGDDAPWVAARWAEVEARTAHDGSLLWSQHLAVRAGTFTRLGGFDADLPTAEDVDLSRRVTAAGGLVRFVPGMVARHHGFPGTLRAFLRRERWHTRAAGWYGRMSPRSRGLVLGGAGWGTLGLVAGVYAAAAGGGAAVAPLIGWAATGTVAVPALGVLAGATSARTAVQDGTLLGLWTAVRVARLPRELAALRGTA